MWLVNRFKNDRELASALTASSHIPCFTGKNTFAEFRGQPVIDGGYANGYEQLCREGTKKCIKVATWYVEGPFVPPEDKVCDPTLCPILAQKNCVVEERKDRLSMLSRSLPYYWLSNNLHSEYLDMANIDLVKDRCNETVFKRTEKMSDPWPEPAFVPQNSTTPDIHPVREFFGGVVCLAFVAGALLTGRVFFLLFSRALSTRPRRLSIGPLTKAYARRPPPPLLTPFFFI